MLCSHQLLGLGRLWRDLRCEAARLTLCHPCPYLTRSENVRRLVYSPCHFTSDNLEYGVGTREILE